ncbi:MAG: hypothetical protein JST88_08295, partial [Bacteroidetes bacterium]|nr:hypothetical protein [Bacteroidota bacterium]
MITKIYKKLGGVLLLFGLLLYGNNMFAQTTVTVLATGSTGTYKTGSVTSAGVLTDGTMSVSNATGTPKGWAVFNIASLNIPANAIITACSLRINKSAVSGSGTATNSILAVASDLSVPAVASSGATVYSSITSGTSVNTTAWGTGTGTSTLALNAAGLTFIQNNLAGIVSMGLSVNASTRVYTITGYAGTSSTVPQLSITYILPCSGTPVAGTASSASSTVCPGINFTLSATGATVAGNITYQWESSPQGANIWGSVSANATNTSYTVSGGITQPTDFRLKVTCANGSGQATSNVVTVNLKPVTQCYCTPGTTDNTSGDNIMNVTFAGINNTTASGGVNGYNDYTSTVSPAQVMAGMQYPVSMLISNGGTEYGGIWFDWNQNGVFDTSEFVNMGSGASPTVLTQTVLVPINAVSGTTRMRVRSKYGSPLANTDPCSSYTYGETEDYSVTVSIPTNCSGIPTAGTAFGPANICSNQSFTLSDTAFTLGVGITYQWDSSAAGANSWSPITGATTPNYIVSAGISTATDYRLVVTCSNGGGQDISNTVSVTLSPFYNCYCAS